jgi:hypothetical protein
VKEEKREESKEIEVLDTGIDMEDTIGSRGVCCGGAIMPFRG